MKKLFLLLLTATVAIITHAQDTYPVTYTIKEKLTATPGTTFAIETKFNVEDPWYIYAPTGNNASQGLVETNIIFHAPKGISKKGKPIQPKTLFKGGFEVYSGSEVKFSQPFEVANDIQPGEYTIKTKITYQTCNEKICLPPKTDELLITVTINNPQGISFENTTFDNLLVKAKQSNKYIFIDAYTTWCGPCKKMAQLVFPTKEAGDFFNKNFVNAKIDMEKGEGIAIAKKYNIHSFPTYLFLDGNGKMIHRFVGSMDLASFLAKASDALDPAKQYGTLLAKYNKGNHDPEFLYSLAYTARSAGEDSISKQIQKKFLSTQKDPLNRKAAKIIFDFCNSTKDPAFQQLKTHKDKFIIAVGAEKYDHKIHQLQLDGYIANKDVNGWAKEQIEWQEKYPSKDWNELNTLAWNFYENVEEKSYLQTALGWALESVKLNSNYANNDTVASLFFKLGEKDRAKIFAEMAIQMGKKENVDVSATEQLLSKINSP